MPFEGVLLAAMASDGRDWKAARMPGKPWEYVSVSVYRDHEARRMDSPQRLDSARPVRQVRTPTWQEMCFIKDQFWGPEETVIQFHPKHSEYVNYHEGCLHLWKPKRGEIELPPSICVGPK